MHAVELDNVSRLFGDVKAVDGVSVQIAAGEFFSMLGPSGSGKTTCLRLVAGFELPDTGRVLLGGDDATRTPPYLRDVNTVFQDYALFPHMNVRDNVAYGLRMKGVDTATRHKRAGELLALVGLDVHGDRRPSQLSGGQRQRVALARALINEPKVLLLDEPLGALDLKLREQMQTELKSLQKRLGITFIYVTHDQSEALAMSDRVAVFSRGRIEQLDAPQTLYERPKTAFVATFVGGSNVVSGAVAERLAGAPGTYSLRKEAVRLAKPDGSGAEAVIADVSFHGMTTRYTLVLDGDGAQQRIVADDKPGRGAQGDRVRLDFDRTALVPLSEEPAAAG